MKMTFQPKKCSRKRVHGFRKRMSSAGGRKVLAARRLKKEERNYQHRPQLFVVFSSFFPRMKKNGIIKKNRDFQNVYKKGRSYANRLLVMYVLENQTDCNRIGISVSKKVGNSVIRHHLTRLIRESYRLHEDMFNNGLDIVVVARVSAKGASYHEVESALLHLGRLHKIISTK